MPIVCMQNICIVNYITRPFYTSIRKFSPLYSYTDASVKEKLIFYSLPRFISMLFRLTCQFRSGYPTNISCSFYHCVDRVIINHT